MMLSDDHALIDPVENVLLRLAVASAADLPKLAKEGRGPRLRLTSAQREMDGRQGTVLLLGLVRQCASMSEWWRTESGPSCLGGYGPTAALCGAQRARVCAGARRSGVAVW